MPHTIKPGLWEYLKAAFNARPAGMFVAPNWVFLGAVALLGAVVPGVWLIGAGLELAYLLGLASNKRFQRWVQGRDLLKQQKLWRQRQNDLLGRLSTEDKAAYLLLEQRCGGILEQQRQSGLAGPAELAQQAEGLSRLMWIYLRLLMTRAAITRVLRESGSGDRDNLESRVSRLDREIAREDLPAELRRSLESQREIVRQRIAGQREARENLSFTEAELLRIREQVELIREQAVLSSDPSALSNRIDEVGSTLNSTTQWMRDKQEVFGKLDALMEEPPGQAMMARE
mgnify:CR=1 FL=1